MQVFAPELAPHGELLPEGPLLTLGAQRCSRGMVADLGYAGKTQGCAVGCRVDCTDMYCNSRCWGNAYYMEYVSLLQNYIYAACEICTKENKMEQCHNRKTFQIIIMEKSSNTYAIFDKQCLTIDKIHKSSKDANK